MWNEVTTEKSKKEIKKMLFWLSLTIICTAIQPWIIGFIFKGHLDQNPTMTYWALGFFLVCILLQKKCEQLKDIARVWILGIHWRELDKTMTERFMDKSVGQHIQESAELSVSHIDKGKWKFLDLQGMLLFEGIPVILQLIISFIAIFVITWIGGLIMTVVLGVYILWSLFLNFQVMKNCLPIDKEFRALNNRRAERMEKVERVKTSGKESQEIEELTKDFDIVITKDRKFWLWFIGNASHRSYLNATGLVIIMAWGNELVWDNVWQLGFLYPLFTWASNLSGNIWRLGAIEHQVNWNLPGVKSMIDSLMMKPEILVNEDVIHDTRKIEKAERISFEEVSHTFPKEKNPNGQRKMLMLIQRLLKKENLYLCFNAYRLRSKQGRMSHCLDQVVQERRQSCD
jgi:ABC-type bacteriocin/lantibiotic exporter with double-glycine peptidase domain